MLRVGDPATETALKASGLIDDLDIEVEWANITGGPKTLEAFRADAIDVGSVADIPPLFAQWTGTDVKIIAARETVDPLEHPTYELGIAPGVDVKTLEDLKGKSIAYSPGQAQGALVLRVLAKAGLTQDDVELVEMASVDDAYALALSGNQVDVAPLGQSLVQHLPAEVRAGRRHHDQARGARRRVDALHAHRGARGREQGGRPQGVRRSVGQGPAVDRRATRRSSRRPSTSSTRASRTEDANHIVEVLGTFEVPTNWDDVIARHQETADLLEKEQDREHLDVADLYDRRYEKAIAETIEASS